MKSSFPEKYSILIKKKAQEHGFDHCGISKAAFLEKEAPKLEGWLKNNYHGKMAYMANHFDKRLDPTLLVPGARSVISFVYNYYPQQKLPENGNYKIAKYAYGKDYHFVVKDKLRALLEDLKKEIGEINGRIFVDSAPVMERQWAAKSGLGWLGKNSLLLNKSMGSFFFLAEMIIDLELEPDGPIRDYCGTCSRCVDACPTNAILPSGVINAGNCISYLTIELKDEIPEDFRGETKDWIFGCDICQDVCPWNRFSRATNEAEFSPDDQLHRMDKEQWQELTREVFNKIFKNSAVKRTGFAGLKRNISFSTKQKSS